ncbi:MAG: hypothetical protein HRT38_11645 [Alteromonadaceae bacterium]|nr:hypothetical protein [Alteromonadaceae bacterium]
MREQLANAAFLVLMYFDVSKSITDYISPTDGLVKGSHPDPVQRIWKLRARLSNRHGFTREQILNNLEFLQGFTQHFLDEYLPYHVDDFERYGSLYLPSYRGKPLIDRVDY